MLSNGVICLRPWRQDDIPALTVLRNDISVQAQLLARVRGSGPDQVRQWLEERSSREDCLFYVIAENGSGDLRGFIQVANMNMLDCRGELGICLLSDARGRNLGGQAIALIVRYLRDYWQLRKLTLSVRSDNTAAIRCYEKAGFEHCGELRQHIFLGGQWHDVLLMDNILGSEG